MNEIDKNEAPDGMIAVAPEDPGLCFGCHYFDISYLPGDACEKRTKNGTSVTCIGTRRKDGQHVVFVEEN